MPTRVETLQEELKTVVEKLVQDYGAQCVILFGSAATGKLSEESDIDLLVIKDTNLSFYDRLHEVAETVEWTHAFEIIVYTPQEFESMKKTNTFVKREIWEKGQVLYGSKA